MGYEEFIRQVEAQIREYLPENFAEALIQVKRVTKNNDVSYDGLIVLGPDGNMAPCVNLGQFYEDYTKGRQMPEIMAEIAIQGAGYGNRMFGISQLGEWDNVKDKVVAHIGSREKNSLFFADKPHTDVEDLAAVYYLNFPLDNGDVLSVPIDYSIQEWFGVTNEELHQTALDNMQGENGFKLLGLWELMAQTMGIDLQEDELQGMPQTYVLTNVQLVNGAALILNDEIRQAIAEMVGDEYYILPSSVHECLIMPKVEGMDYGELEKMVKEINESTVEPKDVLSDNVYEYDARTHELLRSDHAEERRNQKALEDKGARPSLKEKLETKKMELLNDRKGTEPAIRNRKETALE